MIDFLNQLQTSHGFISQHYAPRATAHLSKPRHYFTDSNAGKIDAIREIIERWYQFNMIGTEHYYLLLFCLLEAVPKIANTTGMYQSFLKQFDKRALRPLQLVLPDIQPSLLAHHVHQADSTAVLSRQQSVDIIYLDPPYVPTQYANAYHLPETIIRWDQPKIKGISGTRSEMLYRSDFSSKRYALDALKALINQTNFHHLLLSYSNEGIISHEAIMDTLGQVGNVVYTERPYLRYSSHNKQQLATIQPKKICDRTPLSLSMLTTHPSIFDNYMIHSHSDARWQTCQPAILSALALMHLKKSPSCEKKCKSVCKVIQNQNNHSDRESP